MVELDVARIIEPLDDKLMSRCMVGRRKASVVRVHFKRGTGKMSVNGRDFADYFKLERYLHGARAPLRIASELDARFVNIDVYCNANGGGVTGQAEAIRLAIARKVVELSAPMRVEMRASGYLTCDSRKVESKKYGRHKARRRCQYAKR